jgi:hypothetical protein
MVGEVFEFLAMADGASRIGTEDHIVIGSNTLR